MHGRIEEMARRVLEGELLGREEGGYLASVGGEELYDLFYWANRIRIRFMGPRIRFCAIVAAKVGMCSEDCRFCSQSAHYSTAVQGQSKLTEQQVLDSAAHAASVGADSFGIVNSGRAPTRKELEEWLAPIMRKIAAGGKTRACVSLGMLTEEMVRFLRECGIQRIHHNIETSRRHYPSIVTTHSFEERIRTLKAAKAAGMEICSGGIFGMGETWEDRIDMLLTLRELEINVMPINFLNPIPGTPLEHLPKLPAMECLHVIALCRFMLPRTELKVAGGREACLRDLQSWMFYAGASSTMIGNYLTTYGRPPQLDQQMVRDLGLSWEIHGGGVGCEIAVAEATNAGRPGTICG